MSLLPTTLLFVDTHLNVVSKIPSMLTRCLFATPVFILTCCKYPCFNPAFLSFLTHKFDFPPVSTIINIDTERFINVGLKLFIQQEVKVLPFEIPFCCLSLNCFGMLHHDLMRYSWIELLSHQHFAESFVQRVVSQLPTCTLI